MTPDVLTPFGAFAPTQFEARLLRISQQAPRNVFGKQLAHVMRHLYLRKARLPADLNVGDLRLRCYLRDNTGERKFVFTPWRFDPQERQALAAALPRDGVFVDVGANVGIYTLSAALLLGAAGRIVALEPFPPAFSRLGFNIAATRAQRQDWPRIDALELGVADTDESRALHIDSGNLGGGSIRGDSARFSAQGSRASLIIRCRPLLSMLRELGVARIDALKIDVEGAEDTALMPFIDQADESMLPRLMIVENSDDLWRSDLRGAIVGRGFRVQRRTRLNTIYSRAA